MKLEKLSPEQVEHLKVNREKFIAKFLNSDPINREYADQVIKFVYSLIGKEMPTVYEATDPLAAQQKANELCGTEKKYYQFGSYLSIYWASFYAYYETFVDFGVITEEKFPKYFELRKFIESNIFTCIEFDEAIILCPKPVHVLKNANGMHSLDGPAILWASGYGQHYVNGRLLPKKYFDSISAKTFTVEDFARESNEEYKSTCIAFMQEKFGDEYLVQFFREHLKEVNTYTDKKSEEFLKGTTGGMNVGVYTLFKGQINNFGVAFVRCYCPSTDRMFFLGVEDSITTAKDAIASLYRIPSKLKAHIKSISRQGERFSTILTDEGKRVQASMSEEEIGNLVSISGDEYFQKMKYEY